MPDGEQDASELSDRERIADDRALWGRPIPEGLSKERMLAAVYAIARWEDSDRLPEELVVELLPIPQRRG
jgi:hypothetical protein